MVQPPDPSDDELVRQAIRQPQSSAFAQLVQRHQSRLRLYLRSLAGRADIADELAQESLLKVHRSLSQFKFQSSFKTWLMRIARNTFLDHVRLSSQRKEKLSFSDTEDPLYELEPSNEWTNPQDTEHDQILAIDLYRSLQLLSDAEREVIAHCYFADLSMDETAKLLNMPLGTVKTHSLRALKKLRDTMSSWQTASSLKDST